MANVPLMLNKSINSLKQVCLCVLPFWPLNSMIRTKKGQKLYDSIYDMERNQRFVYSLWIQTVFYLFVVIFILIHRLFTCEASSSWFFALNNRLWLMIRMFFHILNGGRALTLTLQFCNVNGLLTCIPQIDQNLTQQTTSNLQSW